MAKGKRKGKKSGGAAVPTYDSDDERAYGNESAPDPTSDEFFHDDVDQFHAARDKLSLDARGDLEPAAFSSDEEVLAIGEEDEDDEIAEYQERLRQLRRHGVREKRKDSDEEEEDENEGLPNEKAWGQKKNKYYGGDVDDDDDIDFSGSEPDAAILEEQEALAIQKKMAAQLDEEDIGLDIFKPVKQVKKKKKEADEEKEEEKIERDFSTMTRKQKLQLLKKDSPELIELMEDYKLKMKEMQERLLPLLKLIKDGTLPASRGADYIKTKVQLCMNYCININFYLMLKAKHAPVHNHPVIARLVQFRNLLKQLEAVDAKTKHKVDELLDLIKSGKPIVPAESAEPANARKKDRKAVGRVEKVKAVKGKEKRKLSAMLDESSDEEEAAGDEELPAGGRTWGKKSKLEGRYETTDEKDALEYYEMMKSGRVKGNKLGADNEDLEMLKDDNMADLEDDGNEDEEAEGEDDDERRAITYQMSKNKGLTPKRKKEYRNPRVKHRMKFRKANIRRKGQVRQVRTEMTRYAGELSGIRAGVKASRKFKS